MQVLHVASFKGNIGDVASHRGLYNQLKNFCNYNVDIHQCEIRKFYQNRKERLFDEEFVNEANNYDLIVVGGGNFLSPWINTSHTGTTIDITVEMFNKIKVPVFFQSLGCEESLGYTIENIEKLKKFLKEISLQKSPFNYLGLRNDGSKAFVESKLGKEYTENIFNCLDNAFYHYQLVSKRNNNGQYIGICLSSDRIIAKIKENKSFYIKCAEIIENLLERSQEKKIVFFPHVYGDLKLIADLIALLKEKTRREKVIVSPFNPSTDGLDEYIKYFKKCSFVISMRYHGMIIPYCHGIPTIGFWVDDRIDNLYKSIELNEYSINAKQNNSFKLLYEKCILLEKNKSKYFLKSADKINKLREEGNKFFERVFSEAQ